MFISCCELPTDKQREGLCICFWPLLNISHWRKNPQRNHINFCVLTTWHTDPTTPNVPNVLQRSDHRRLPLDPCFGKICQLRHVPCREMTRHVDKREFQKANIQELYVIFFFLWGSCKEKGVGSATFFYFFFQDWFPWMTLMMSVVCLGCWWSEGEGREGGMEGWRGGERSEK